MPIGLFALCIGAVSLFAISGRSILASASGSLLNPIEMTDSLKVGSIGGVAASLVLAALVVKSGHSGLALTLFFIGMAGIAALSWFKQGDTAAAPAAALLSFIVLMVWRAQQSLHAPRIIFAVLFALIGVNNLIRTPAWIYRANRFGERLAYASLRGSYLSAKMFPRHQWNPSQKRILLHTPTAFASPPSFGTFHVGHQNFQLLNRNYSNSQFPAAKTYQQQNQQ